MPRNASAAHGGAGARRGPVRWLLLLALAVRACGLETCPVTADQVLPFVPPSDALQRTCKDQPGDADKCADECLCTFGTTLRKAAAAAGVATPSDKQVITACAIDSLPVLYERGLSTVDILRVSKCDFSKDNAPECLRTPVNVPAAQPSNSGTVRTKEQAQSRFMDAFVAVVVVSLTLSFLLWLAVGALSTSEGACNTLSSLHVSRIDYTSCTAHAHTPLRARLARRGACTPATGPAILSDVSVSLSRGQLVAIIGPSGCGKSTLLNIMAGELVLGSHQGAVRATGSIFADGEPLTAGTAARLRRCVGYVAQDDELLSTLSVREAVRFSAALRLPAGADVEAAVTSVLAQLDLRRVADSRIGGANASRGVSGGERRRVSVAQELVVDPSVLFLDEPSSGLDSYTAGALIETLARLASEGRIVVATVHQPSFDAYSRFSSVLLLARGVALWQGAPSDAHAALAAAGLSCPEGVNVADKLLQVACTPGDCDALLESRRLGPATAETRMADNAASPRSDRLLALQHVSRQQACCAATKSAGAELRILFRRELAHYARSPALLATHVAVAALLALWIGVVYFRVKADLSGFQNRAGAAFFTAISFGFAALSALELFIAGRPLLRKEAHRYFHPLSYFLVKVAADGVFLRLIPAALYGVILYFMMGWAASATKFFVFMAALLLTAVSTSALAIAVSMLVSTTGVGTVVMSFILLQMAIFGGFLSNTSSMPQPVAWLRFLSLFFYAFESMLANELDGLHLDFTVSGFVSVKGVDGSSFLTTLELNPQRIGMDLICLLCLSSLFVAAAALLLMLRAAPPGGYLHGLSRRQPAKAHPLLKREAQLSVLQSQAVTESDVDSQLV